MCDKNHFSIYKHHIFSATFLNQIIKTIMWHFPHYSIHQPINWQIMEQQFSWFAEMRGVPQDAQWHAEGDVWIHTKMVVEALLALPEFQALNEQDKHILLAAAMLHDVEKRSTTTEEIVNGQRRIVSPRHAKKGEHTARCLLYTEWNAPFVVREQIAKLVRLHGLPLWAIDKPHAEHAVMAASLQVNTQHLAMLAKADVLGRVCHDQADILLRIELFQELCREHDCWGQARAFASDYGRFLYLNRRSVLPDYQPFDDLAFDVYMMSALPASGKDAYIQQHFANLPMLSLDEIRRAHRIEPTDKKQASKVIQLAREQAKIYLRAQQPFVFNATNITREMRGKWLDLFHDYGARTHLIYIDVPYRQLLAQNRHRQYDVPEAVIHKLLMKLEIPDYDEAHSVQYITRD